MAFSRSFRRTLGIASIAALLTAGLIAPPAQAAASITNKNFDCDSGLGNATTKVTANEGDTFTITNTGVGTFCTFLGTFRSVVTVSGLVGPSLDRLASTQTATVKVLRAGSFRVGGNGVGDQTFSIAINAVDVTASYTMTFDANGGTCVGDPDGLIRIGRTGGVSYLLPSDQCTRVGYKLLGWSFDQDATDPHNLNTRPGEKVLMSANATMYAVWEPTADFNEITYDANVDKSDFCKDKGKVVFPIDESTQKELDLEYLNFFLKPGKRTKVERTQVVLLGADSTLLEQPACFPMTVDKRDPNPKMAFWRLVGWNTKANGTGTQYYLPSKGETEEFFKLGGAGGQTVHLYAQWQTDPCPTVEAKSGRVAPPAFFAAQWAGCNLTDANLTDAELIGANLTGANLTGADLTGASLYRVTSGRIIATRTPVLPKPKFKLSDAGNSDGNGNWKLANGYLVGPGADLSGADLTDADLSGADLTDANLAGAKLAGVISGNRSQTKGIVLRGGIFVQLDLLPKLPDGWILRNHYLIGPKAKLNNAWLAEEDLFGANLTGANLTGANLTNATLTGVTWSNTICPDGTASNESQSKTCGGS